MDKYTVDLDQVLNDFEYSELTDQHLKNVPESSQPHIPFQSPSVTKHSINNVFHSLNEYLNLDLNSSISSGNHTVETSDTPKNKSPNVEDNKLEFSINDKQTVDTDKHEVSVRPEPQLNTNNKLTEFCEKNHPDVNPKGKPVDFDNEYVSEVECLTPMENSITHTVDSPKTDTNTEEALVRTLEPVNNDSECDRNVNFKSDSLLEQNDYNFSNKDRNWEAFDGVNDAEAEGNCDKHVELVEEVNVDKEGVLVDISDCQEHSTQANLVSETHNLLDMAPEDFHQIAVPTEQIKEVKEGECEERVIERDSHDEMQEEKLDQKVQEVESTEPPLETTFPDQNENFISNKQFTTNDKLADNEIIIDSNNVTTKANKLDQTDPQAVEMSQQKVIGFSADIDIDENELNKMLEDLELEEENVLKPIEEPISAESGEINAKEESVQAGHKDAEDTNNEKIHIAEVAEAEEASSSPPQILKCLEVQPQQKVQQSFSVPPENETTEIFSAIEEETSRRGESFLQYDQPEESVSRPQDLPLNNQLSDETGGRKINLIGSPGSTPYNNVYINKSIDSKTTHNIESDYTSSASPTFSDCSTGSTSTASTVSIEELPNNEDKFTSKSAGLKNTNLEGQNFKVKSENIGRVLEERDSPIQGSIDSDEINEQTVTQAASLENSQGASSIEIINESRVSEASGQTSETFLDKSWLGKQAPLWIPDADASACLHCDMKFTVIKRRHHCRACGLVLCSKCCNLRCRLEYLDSEARVCNKCYTILSKNSPNNAGSDNLSSDSGNSPAFRPNPNNPLEYCSTVSPLQQAGQTGTSPPSVMVPVGVLKRKGSSKKSNKSVMFCDGIAPGSDLTNLDQDFNYNPEAKTNIFPVRPKEAAKETEPVQPVAVAPKITKNMPKIDESTSCFIPKSETSLPPTMSLNRTDMIYSDCSNSPGVVEMLKNETLAFALNQNLLVHVKIVNMNCCINKHAWCFSSEGLINVGCDEVVYLIEYIDEESYVPKDVFFHVHNIYEDALKGTSIKELGISLHNTANFLDSKNHAGFVYIKPTFQCLENVIIPQEPYLIGILIHRWETPWAKLFPLRLILRLGAEYRYYPSPLISSRHRDSVYVEIGHTIINLLADFRNFTYSLPQIRGLIIHMEDKKTTITIPKNRYDMIMKSINNSSEHILAFAGNFSREADSHLVCIQDTQGHENCYTTHAINIHNKPRKITGASFIVFNGSLKSSSGLTAKSNIVEDGLMIQIPSEHMDKIRDDLRNMKNHTIACGCINADSDESVNIVWGENDTDFNSGVKSPIDLRDLKGIPSIRVHNGQDYLSSGRMTLVRWTEVFILQNVEDNPRNQDPVDISKVSESIAKACCTALVKYLDLLISNNCQKVGIRATLHVDQVSYLAGSGGFKLAPIYMRSLDNELISVLHQISSNNLGDNSIELELIFRILNA
ncbi:zinc finger FYVE domain-containing protein 16 isoform X2 [Euwallacea similis]|uniref:zinc finger FYVE domain-containing protein 16 isoform X2 n=1 Tax=Euwallacea similis TaxID=1736056 RepID=UPI00344D3AD0